MKQLIISKNVALATSLENIEDGALAFVNISDGTLIASQDDIKGNFSVICGRGDNKMLINFPEVDIKSLTVAKASYEAGTNFQATITVPTTEKGIEYTVIVTKLGTVFNERSNWTFTSLAKGTIAADVAKDIVDQINANTSNLGVTATNSGGSITIKGVETGIGFKVLGADGLMGIEPTSVTEAKKAVLDKAYIQDLASRCAAGKGFNYLYGDGKEIYPGYPEVVSEDQYTLYSLRFAVPRASTKQRDEVVYQTLHIAVPVASPSIAELDVLFDTGDIIEMSNDTKIKD